MHPIALIGFLFYSVSSDRLLGDNIDLNGGLICPGYDLLTVPHFYL